MEILHNHVSQETAYVVEDYPYGFRLRCKIRYWLEYRANKGFRFISQTTNPKCGNNVWNKEKASTYYRFGACIFLDDKNHVQFTGLSEYSDAKEIVAWCEKYGEGVPEVGKDLLKRWKAAKIAYDANRNPEDLNIGLTAAYKAFNKPE